MQRTQIYITDEQAREIKRVAHQRSVSMAHVIHAALDTGDSEAEARALILATAGILPDAPDWPERPRAVRGRPAADRLRDRGG